MTNAPQRDAGVMPSPEDTSAGNDEPHGRASGLGSTLKTRDACDSDFSLDDIPRPPLELIAQAHLLAGLPASIKRKLAADGPIVVVIETSSPKWSDALADAARIVWRLHVLIGGTGKRNKSKKLHVHGPIVALASDLATLSRTVVASADYTVAIRPNAKAVALAIEMVCGGRARVRSSDVVGLEPDDLAFAIQRNMTPRPAPPGSENLLDPALRRPRKPLSMSARQTSNGWLGMGPRSRKSGQSRPMFHWSGRARLEPRSLRCRGFSTRQRLIVTQNGHRERPVLGGSPAVNNLLVVGA